MQLLFLAGHHIFLIVFPGETRVAHAITAISSGFAKVECFGGGRDYL